MSHLSQWFLTFLLTFLFCTAIAQGIKDEELKESPGFNFLTGLAGICFFGMFICAYFWIWTSPLVR